MNFGKSKTVIPAAILSIAAVAGGAESQLPQKYQHLAKRSIFSSREAPKPRPLAADTEPVKVVNPLDNWVFRGSLSDANGSWALLENTESSWQTKLLAAGDTVLECTVDRVTADSVTIKHADDQSRTLDIGMSLSGERVSAAPVYSSVKSLPDSPASSSSEAARPAGSSDTQSILEKLRQRRQQNMGR